MKRRGRDHVWKLIKFKGDMGIYATCKCGYTYFCGCPAIEKDYQFYPYCPYCGSKKKEYMVDIELIDEEDGACQHPTLFK